MDKRSEPDDFTNEILEKGIAAVRALIDNSWGVSGLHLNGEDAPWDSLEKGGAFEEWLIAFNAAEDVIARENK